MIIANGDVLRYLTFALRRVVDVATLVDSNVENQCENWKPAYGPQAK